MEFYRNRKKTVLTYISIKIAVLQQQQKKVRRISNSKKKKQINLFIFLVYLSIRKKKNFFFNCLLKFNIFCVQIFGGKKKQNKKKCENFLNRTDKWDKLRQLFSFFFQVSKFVQF